MSAEGKKIACCHCGEDGHERPDCPRFKAEKAAKAKAGGNDKSDKDDKKDKKNKNGKKCLKCGSDQCLQRKCPKGSDPTTGFFVGNVELEDSEDEYVLVEEVASKFEEIFSSNDSNKSKDDCECAFVSALTGEESELTCQLHRMDWTRREGRFGRRL